MLNTLGKLLFVFYVFTAAFYFVTARETDGSISNSEAKSMQQNTSDAKSHYDRGTDACRKEEWDNAISDFNEAIRLNAKDARVYESRGYCYFAKGDSDNAISDFTHAIQLNPTNANAYLSRGTTYRAKQEYDKAMIDLNECLRLNPTNAMAYKTRAAVLGSKGVFEQEISDWNQGLRLAPNDATALALRGFAYFMTSQFEKAIADYNQAIHMNPTNDLAYNNLAWLRATCPVERLRDGKEAVEAATKACELTDWKRWSWVDTLASAYAEMGDFEKAIRYQKQALDMNGISEIGRKNMQRQLSRFEQHQPNHEAQKQ